MSKKITDFLSLLIPSDILPLSMILLGIIIAFLINEIAITLIGISISILGIVVLLMKLTTRMSSVVDSKFKASPAPNFKITVKKDNDARRQVIEDFDKSFDDDYPEKKEDSVPNEPKTEEDLEDLGFRIIKKDNQKESDAKEVEEDHLNQINDKHTEVTDEEEDKNSTKLENSSKDTDEDEKIISELDGKNDIENHDENNLNEEQELIQKEQNSKIKNDNIESTAEIIGKTKNEDQVKKEDIGSFKKKEVNIQMQSLLEEMPLLKDEPSKEFDFFISRILMAIRSVSNTKTAAFFLYNSDNNELILDSYSSESEEIYEKRKKFKVGNDIISQISINTKPEILTDIKPAAELDLIPYYKNPTGTNSLIGIPVMLNRDVIGVLCADSNSEDAYNTVMVGFLGHFTKLISGLIRSYTEKYDLVRDSKILGIINNFISEINDEGDLDLLSKELTETIHKVIDCRNAGVITYNHNLKSWKLSSYTGEDKNNFKDLNILDLNDTIVGDCIENKEKIITGGIDNTFVRLSKEEEELPNCYFICIPFTSDNSCYGALFIEGKEHQRISSDEIHIIEQLIKNAIMAIEKIEYANVIGNSLLQDPETGILNKKMFEVEISKEISRVKKFGVNSSLMLFEPDKYESFDPEKYHQRYVKLHEHILENFGAKLSDIDSIGKLDENLYGVILSGYSKEKSKLWAEKIRNEIASSTFKDNGETLNITISAGISEITQGSRKELAIDNANHALNKSLSKTNTVSIYS